MVVHNKPVIVDTIISYIRGKVLGGKAMTTQGRWSTLSIVRTHLRKQSTWVQSMERPTKSVTVRLLSHDCR